LLWRRGHLLCCFGMQRVPYVLVGSGNGTSHIAPNKLIEIRRRNRRILVLVALSLLVLVVLAVAALIPLVVVLTSSNGGGSDDDDKGGKHPAEVTADICARCEDEGVVVLSEETLGTDLYSVFKSTGQADELELMDVLIFYSTSDSSVNTTLLTETKNYTTSFVEEQGFIKVDATTDIPKASTRVLITGFANIFDIIYAKCTLEFFLTLGEKTKTEMSLVVNVNASFSPSQLSFFSSFNSSFLDDLVFHTHGYIAVTTETHIYIMEQRLEVAKKGVNIYYDGISIDGLDSVFQPIEIYLNNSFDQISVGFSAHIPLHFFTEILGIEDTVENSTLPNFLLTLKNTAIDTKYVSISSGGETIIQIEGIVSPRLLILTNFEISLAPLNPDMYLTVKGEYNSTLGFVIFSGSLNTGWNDIFGITGISIGAPTVTLGINPNNLTESYVHVEGSIQFDFDGVNNQTINIFASLNAAGEFSLVSDEVSIESLTSLITGLLGFSDSVDISDFLDFAQNIKVRIGVSVEETQLVIPAYEDYSSIVTTVGRGVSLISYVDTGGIIEQISESFPGHIFPSFQAAIVVPVFDATDALTFQENFEIFLRTEGFPITEEFQFLGFEVATHPFKTTLLFSAQALLTITGDDLLFQLGGEISSLEFILGGSMLGTWTNVFGVNGLGIGDLAVEIGVIPNPAGVVLSTVGLAGSVFLGKVHVILQGSVSISDFTEAYLRAEIHSLNLVDLILFAQQASDSQDNLFNNIDTSILTGISFEELVLLVAPKNGELQGIQYRKGFEISGSGVIFFSDFSVSIAITDRYFGTLSVPDFVLSFSLVFTTVSEAIVDFVEFLFPEVDLGPLSDILSGIAELSDLFSIESIALSDFSLFGLFDGELPVLELELIVLGEEYTVDTSVGLDDFALSFDSFLRASNLDTYAPSCIYNSHCDSDEKCDHTKEIWSCVADCGSEHDVPLIGCFIEDEVTDDERFFGGVNLPGPKSSNLTLVQQRNLLRELPVTKIFKEASKFNSEID